MTDEHLFSVHMHDNFSNTETSDKSHDPNFLNFLIMMHKIELIGVDLSYTAYCIIKCVYKHYRGKIKFRRE